MMTMTEAIIILMIMISKIIPMTLYLERVITWISAFQSYITSRRRSGVVIVNLTWESQHAIDAVRGAESLETSRIRIEESLKYSKVQEHLACLIAVRIGRLPISDMRSRPVRL